MWNSNQQHLVYCTKAVLTEPAGHVAQSMSHEKWYLCTQIYACLIAVNGCLHWSLHMPMVRICKVNHSCDAELGDIHGIQT